jgi:hypothetical protein
MRRRRPPKTTPVSLAVHPAEKACFEEAMADVKRFPAPPIPARPSPPAPLPLQRQKDELAVRTALSRTLNSDEILEAGDEWLYLQQGQSPALLRDLRKGVSGSSPDWIYMVARLKKPDSNWRPFCTKPSSGAGIACALCMAKGWVPRDAYRY